VHLTRVQLAWLTVGVLGLGSGCVSTRVPPVAGPEAIPIDLDEQELWEDSAKFDEYMSDRKYVYEDEALQQYVQSVAERLLPHMGESDVETTARILKDPFRNAICLPNGSVYLHSGILASLENEAQLATLLGHELSHYLRRHSLKEKRSAENRRTVANVFLGTLVVIAALGGDPAAAISLGHDANSAMESLLDHQVNGYSQDLEREADKLGFQAMVAAGYDPREAPRIFRVLMAEREAQVPEPYYYGSHPRVEERLRSYEKRLSKIKGTLAYREPGRVGKADYEEHIAELLLRNAELNLRLARVDFAREEVARYLEIAPQNADGHFFQGQVYRKHSRSPQDLALAVDSYERAVALRPEDAASRRELGLLYRSLDRHLEAKAQLDAYLEIKPEAIDRPIIESYISTLDLE
jgi:predicted Zn-dependent protease